MDQVERSRAEPNRFARDLFDGLPERYDTLQELLSFRQNRRWRGALVDAVADAGDAGPGRRVLDVATGTAGVALLIADRTGARVVGVDLTEEMLRRGRQRVDGRDRADRISLAVGRAEQLPFRDHTFEALTFTYLLRYVADPAATLAELVRVLRPGGVVASLEFGVPQKAVWLLAWRLYTRALLPAAGLVAGGREWARVGWFLGPSIEQYYLRYPLEQQVALWRAAGLTDVRVRRFSLGGGVVMSGRKADD